MAFKFNSLVHSRAFSSKIPLSIRGVSKVTNKNHASLLESESEPAPDEESYPFHKFTGPTHSLDLVSEYKNENITLITPSDKPDGEKDAETPMAVWIARGTQELYFDITAQPDQFKIHELAMRRDGDEHLENFEEFITSKGIDSGMINMLFNRFGVEHKIRT